MEFTPANAWHEFKTAGRTEQGTLDDNGNDVILDPLNKVVREHANGYLEKFEPESKNKATDERAKLLDLHWGRIEHDGAQLRGLGAAITDIAETLAANVTTLGGAWEGESYDAFSAAIAKVQRTLAEYGTAATTTGDGLVNAMGQARELYQTFADDSREKHLNFENESKPGEWHRIGEPGYTPDDLANGCPTTHLGVVDYNADCVKNNDEQRAMIDRQWVSQRRWDILMRDGCEESLDRVSIMYSNVKAECDAAVERIKGKLDNYFGAVTTTVDGVTKLYDAALGNVYNLAHAEVFSSLRVIGGGGVAPGGGPSTSDAPPVAAVEPVQPGPVVEPVAETVVEPVAEPVVEPVAEPVVEPPADTTTPAAAAPLPPYTVQIQDGDRTLAVTSPPGEGTVRVTVTQGTGATKSYELDFATASGLRPFQEESADPADQDGEPVEKVPARTDGKCVIQDGDVTITAERPLFSPDSLNVTVQDGAAAPTRYTLDFDNLPSQEDTPAPPTAGAQPAPPAAEAPEPLETDGFAAPTLGEVDGSTSLGEPAPADGAAAVAETGGSPASAGSGEPAVDEADGLPAVGGSTAPEAAGSGEPVADGASAEPSEAAPEQPVAETDATPPASNGATSAAAADVSSGGHWLGEEAGSVSGILVPDKLDQPDNPDVEAGLPKADDVPDDPTPPKVPAADEVGAGLPIMGTPGTSTSTTDTGRAGSGWSVHGDLFDTTEPVYSMHGVLGDEDRSAESEHGTR